MKDINNYRNCRNCTFARFSSECKGFDDIEESYK